MNAKDFNEKLIELGACEEAVGFCEGKSFEDAYKQCERGDWMLWLFQKTNPEKLRELTLAKAHCASTVKHLMNDPRSLAAIEEAIKFGNGGSSVEDLRDAYAYAADAADAAYAAYAAAAAAAAAAAYAADAAYAAAAAYDAAANRQQTADICRKYLPIEIWNL